MIYFDNNSTTISPKEVINDMIVWTNKGNPSSSYKSAEECRDMMKELRTAVCSALGVKSGEIKNLYDITDDEPASAVDINSISDDSYFVVFTSCASESNNFILRSVCDTYYYNTRRIPHIIISSIEHKSLLLCAKQLEKMRKAFVTYVKPNKLGFIDPKSIPQYIRQNTCLISIMAANNETGAINDIDAIAKIAHEHNVIFHSDAVQYFGKLPLDLTKVQADAISISFHKIYGPPGIGALVIKERFVRGFRLQSQICGTQQGGLRGGTESTPILAGAFRSLKYCLESRASKNAMMLNIKKFIVNELSQRIPCRTLHEYHENQPKFELEIIFISGSTPEYTPGTLLFSIMKYKEPFICNTKIKKYLEAEGIVISIGSACNTSSSKASHVIEEMGADQYMKNGTLRLSLGDNNTLDEAKKFIRVLLLMIKNDMKKITK